MQDLQDCAPDSMRQRSGENETQVPPGQKQIEADYLERALKSKERNNIDRTGIYEISARRECIFIAS